jgi:anti-sigma factor RsiW
MSAMCSVVSVALPTLGIEGIGGRIWSHVESCDECRSLFIQYDEMYEALAELRYTYMAAPGGLPQRVMASLGPVAVPDSDERWDHVLPVAAAAALATAAAGTAVIFRFYRHRAA